MGRKSKKQNSKASSKSEKSTKKKTAVDHKYSIEQLLDKAEEFIDSFEYDLAQRFCKRALEMDSSHPRALEMTGSLMLDLGDMESAQDCFNRAVEVEPDTGHSKYMCLGQLLTGPEAVQCFQKGIEIMAETLEKTQKEQVESACSSSYGSISPHEVSSAYCSVAEIYLTDECFEDDAEDRCRKSLEKALEMDEENAEAYHLLASFWLSKEDKQKAREMIDKGVSLWLPSMKEADKPEGAQLDPVQTCQVSYPARINAAKTLIEVENYQVATEVLELLLEEEDEVVEVWYLLGWVHYLQGCGGTSSARHYLNKAQKIAKTVGCDEEEMVAHIAELVTELGPGDGTEDTEEDEAENGEMEVDTDSESEEETETSCTTKNLM